MRKIPTYLYIFTVVFREIGPSKVSCPRGTQWNTVWEASSV
uniref:Uncharacterized protein n=1 Tax=Anguilla anguilla TaxID=7936 RepID=A0A0E9R6J7_ANGAN